MFLCFLMLSGASFLLLVWVFLSNSFTHCIGGTSSSCLLCRVIERARIVLYRM